MREIKFRAWLPSIHTMLKGVHVTSLQEIGVTEYQLRIALPEHMGIEESESIILNTVTGDSEMHVTFLSGLIWIEDAKILQYTGLKDINGAEIYEGDIFRIEFLNDCIVEYVVRWIEEEHAFCFAEIERLKYEDDTDIWRRMTYEWTDRVTRLKRLKLTVIGNIYENQDLLKS